VSVKKGERRLMDLDWVREIDAHCTAFGVPHFFKLYYKNGQGLPREDGVLDGQVRQAWPQSTHLAEKLTG